jgi:hypothetical protein
MRWQAVRGPRAIGKEGPEGTVVIQPGVQIQREAGGEVQQPLGVIADGGAGPVEWRVRGGADSSEVRGGEPRLPLRFPFGLGTRGEGELRSEDRIQPRIQVPAPGSRITMGCKGKSRRERAFSPFDWLLSDSTPAKSVGK